jgi:hypothetical protein
MGMKEWAQGVTHYTLVSTIDWGYCWKHDAFKTSYDGGSDPVEIWGAQLVQQEPDASSFLMELEILLKQEDTLGILHLQRSFGGPHYVSNGFYLLHRSF